MNIKILGTGCPSCQALEEKARTAVAELGIEAQIEHIREIDKIIAYGVMSAPAIVVNEEVKAAGRVPEVEEIKGWLK